MENRPTTEVKTPIGGQTVKLHTWLTGREKEYIQEPIIAQAMVRTVAGRPEVDGVASSSITESTHRTVEMMVVSVGETTGKAVLDAVLDMQGDDYEFVLATIEQTLKKNR